MLAPERSPSSTVSIDPPGTRYEIWLFARKSEVHPNGYRQHIEECGLFATEGEALRAGAALRLWLRIGVWPDSVLDGIVDGHADPSGDRLGLMGLPAFLRCMSVDPSRTLVTARRFASEGDNQRRPEVGDDNLVHAPGW